MQALAQAREKPPAQKQWKNNGKDNAQGDGNRRKSGRMLTHCLVISTPTQANARRQEAPGADFDH
jgi:hypothetical protein